MYINNNLLIYLLVAAAGVYYLCKLKKEWILLSLMTISWATAAFFNAAVEENWKCSMENMERALQQCAVMLKSGEQLQLHERLTTLLASPEMETRKAAKISLAFAKKMGVASVPEKKMPSIYWGIIWIVLLLVWCLLYHFRLKHSVRIGYLAIVTVLALSVLCLVYVAAGVQNAYGCAGFRGDIELLGELVFIPQFRPQLLPMLEKPEMRGFTYLRNRPKVSAQLKE